MSVLLNEKINSYLELLNDKQKEAVLSVAKAFAEDDQDEETEEYSDEFKQELDEAYEAYLNGEPAFTWEEIKEKTNRILYGDGKQ